MADIATTNNARIPAPQRDRDGHLPAPGDIYLKKDTYYPKIIKIKEIIDEHNAKVLSYNFDNGLWGDEDDFYLPSLNEYYVLLLDDFAEVVTIASKANAGDSSRLMALLGQARMDDESLALVASRPADQVLALTEASERLQDKLEAIDNIMKMQVSHMRQQTEAKVATFEKELKKVKDYVQNLHRIITVMNLYTGANVDIVVVSDGTPAEAGLPITIRQRILFMDEEYLADAENGGIDCNDLDRFCKWLQNPANRDIICPEPKCVVAMKPKRFNKDYSRDDFTNELMNKWNRHTIVFFRDGERLLMVDSESLELYDTAIPWSDQAERFAKEYDRIMAGTSFRESNLENLKRKSENLGYMYTKYLSFLQGMVDSGKIFDLSAGRPNFAKGDGVAFVRDAENAIGTGESWYAFQKRINGDIRRGTRVVFFPYGHDERGCEVSCGKANRWYGNDRSAPAAPRKGIYNVDYPTKTHWVRNDETGMVEKKALHGEKLAIFYSPERWYTDSNRNEAWIYNPWCVLNYDKLTIKDIDRFMADRTQRETFRGWMPILQEARKRLVEEKREEEAFIMAIGNVIMKEHPEIYLECIGELIEQAIAWWKEKVIFTRPLRDDDAKAWRMIKKRVVQLWEKNG